MVRLFFLNFTGLRKKSQCQCANSCKNCIEFCLIVHGQYAQKRRWKVVKSGESTLKTKNRLQFLCKTYIVNAKSCINCAKNLTSTDSTGGAEPVRKNEGDIMYGQACCNEQHACFFIPMSVSQRMHDPDRCVHRCHK